MTTDILEKAKALEKEITELELDITGYECLLKKLQTETVVMHIEGISRFSYKVNGDLVDCMINHYRTKIRKRQFRLETLKKLFLEL